MERLAALPDKGEQAVVLVPRRGYSPFLGCRSCGEVVMCPHCDVPLTVHRGSGGREWLRCHWCDHRDEVGNRCSHCGSTAFKPFGAGTQRVLELLAQELEDLRLLRFDRDSTGGRDGHRRLLDRFAAGEADVLIGTQMLAKGMDLPRVTLAAVLAADGLLHRPDLRASEQAMQLLLQLAGRAGRGERPGQVLVQTYNPDHPVIRHLVDGRYEAFLNEEVALRREAALVPFSRACLLRLSGESASATATAASVLAERIRPICQERSWWLLGPAPAPWLGWRVAAVGNCCCMGLSTQHCRYLPDPPSGMNYPVVWRCRLTPIRWSSDLRRAVRGNRTPAVDARSAASGSAPGAPHSPGCRSPGGSSASGALPVLKFPRA